jgi:hypothetical protein
VLHPYHQRAFVLFEEETAASHSWGFCGMPGCSARALRGQADSVLETGARVCSRRSTTSLLEVVEQDNAIS